MARRFGRRRKPRVVWLPNVGTPDYFGASTPANVQPAQIDTQVGITMGGGRAPTINIPLVLDNPPIREYADANPAEWRNRQLQELLEWGYRLRRIVGKLHVTVGTAAAASVDQLVPRTRAGLYCYAGLMVRQVDPTTGIALALSGAADAINVWTNDNIRDPWIWRRSWLLKNANWRWPLSSTAGTTDEAPADDGAFAISSYPRSTAEYNSVADGPHVDQKTARIVGPEERLFLDLSFRIPFGDDGIPTDWSVGIHFDYRVLASLRQSQGNRRNATR